MKQTQILKDLRAKDGPSLTKELADLDIKLAKLRTDLAFRKLKNVQQIHATRQQIARVWTILNEKIMAKIANISEKEATR